MTTLPIPVIQIDFLTARKWLPVTLSLSRMLQRLLVEMSGTDSSKAVTLNFKDPNYSSECGGFHPVEIRLERTAANIWQLSYITDFAYFGRYYPELEKEIDFNFSTGIGYQTYVGDHPLNHFSGLYRLWEANFRSYLTDNIYQITIHWD